MTKEEIQQYVYDFLTDKGLTHETCCAIMGNITGESGWDVECIEQGTGVGFGLCQWSFGRRTALENYGTDLQHQCEFLWSELTGENTADTGASCQWIANPADSVTPDTSYSFALQDFLDGKGTIEELTTAWCYCWERPAYDTNHLDRRIASAKNFATYMTYNGTGIGDSNKIIESAIEWAKKIANDDTHGYDQANRWGPDYDCSSFVISAYTQSGVDLKSVASYTGDLEDGATKVGFIASDFTDVSDLLPGDLILKSGHVIMYIGNNEIVQASINENGDVTGGQTGDQTGNEISVRSWYDDAWTRVLRLPSTVRPNPPVSKENLYSEVCKTRYVIKNLSDEQVAEMKKLKLEGECMMKFTFDRNKTFIGKNFYNKKLNFNTRIYIIKNVDVNGYAKIVDKENSYYFNIINPIYLKEVN